MTTNNLIASLNDAQRLAVSAANRSLLVLAGAGSGKTRVLVHRIAWHIQVNRLSPHAILAVTFTNKAAREMRGRLENLLNISADNLWIGTFHGLSHRLLRLHCQAAKLPNDFQVMDSQDQLRLIKRLLKASGIDEEVWQAKQVMWFINNKKEQGIRAKNAATEGDAFEQKMVGIYQDYEDLCQRSGLVDFAELLLRADELLRHNPAILQKYRLRFEQVLVDEFQDTNTVQYKWLKLLTEGRDNLFAVGDDDQSIYGWRGAKVENLHHFQADYPNHLLLKLEQNYRSSGNILDCANALITKNPNRIGKKLWTADGAGEPVSLYDAFDEQDEANFVIDTINQWSLEGNKLGETAILYRSNAQSRQFEELLMTKGIAYQVYGGLRFFERAEIKNVLAYLRLLNNPADDASFERIVNTPTRGIGNKTIVGLRDLASQQQITLWQAASKSDNKSVANFVQLIGQMSARIDNKSLDEQVQIVIDDSGLIGLYKKDKQDRGEAKIENLQELVNAARSFDATPEDETSKLTSFLTNAALEAGDGKKNQQDCTQLMTLHSAKGLEFKLVFLVGMEDGLLPSSRASETEKGLEEERRLCYVGITRAQQHLYLSYAQSRYLYGKSSYSPRSRFLAELPTQNIQHIRPNIDITNPQISDKPSKYHLGQQVSHPKFGDGVVLEIASDNESMQINFQKVGLKWLATAYANLS